MRFGPGVFGSRAFLFLIFTHYLLTAFEQRDCLWILIVTNTFLLWIWLLYCTRRYAERCNKPKMASWLKNSNRKNVWWTTSFVSQAAITLIVNRKSVHCTCLCQFFFKILTRIITSPLKFNPFSQEWSNSNFPCSLTRKITSHSMENLAFHSLLR